MVEQRFVLCRRGVAMIALKWSEILQCAVLCMLHDVAPMVDIRSEFERVRGVKSLGQSRSAWHSFRQKAVWVTSESGTGRAEKLRYDVPQGVGVKNRYEAELTNQRRGSGSKT